MARGCGASSCQRIVDGRAYRFTVHVHLWTLDSGLCSLLSALWTGFLKLPFIVHRSYLLNHAPRVPPCQQNQLLQLLCTLATPDTRRDPAFSSRVNIHHVAYVWPEFERESARADQGNPRPIATAHYRLTTDQQLCPSASPPFLPSAPLYRGPVAAQARTRRARARCKLACVVETNGRKPTITCINIPHANAALLPTNNMRSGLLRRSN